MSKLSTITAIAMAFIITGCATTPQATELAGVSNLPPVSTIPGQTSSIGAAATIAGRMAGISPGATQTPALVGILSQQLGISPVQAMGGAGSIFSVARQMMGPSKFGLVNNAVPGMSQMLGAAPNLAGSNSLLGSAASALGGGTNLGQMAMLASSFQSLGLNAGMVNQFIPVILQYVQSQGGPSTMGLLQSALMP